VNSKSHNPSKWVEEFRRREKLSGGILCYFSNTTRLMHHLLEKIALNTPPGGKILEIGIGTGFNSIWLSHYNGKQFDVHAVDIDEGVLSYASRNIEFFRSGVELIKDNMFHLQYPDAFFDLVFSDGVLEHFSDDEIKNALKEMFRVGKKVIFTVPGRKSKGNPANYGDERLLTPKQWIRILSDTPYRINEIFGTSWKTKDRIFAFLLRKTGFRRYAYLYAKSFGFVLTR
jgi:ubiquinone/menaquinone biosynthesis C-methylase UbiE